MLVRPAVLADAEVLRKIYNLEVLGSTVTFDLVARSEEEQAEWMESHAGVYPVIVAEDEGVVIGFASLSPYRPRPAYSTTVEDSVYVATSHRGAGVGKLLLSELVERGKSHGFHAIIGRIVGDHEASIALHRSCGFELVGGRARGRQEVQQVARRRRYAATALTKRPCQTRRKLRLSPDAPGPLSSAKARALPDAHEVCVGSAQATGPGREAR